MPQPPASKGGQGRRPEERVQAILEACREIIEAGGDPFTIDVRVALQTLGELLTRWRRIQQLLLDAEAIEALSSVLRMQAERLAQEASSLQVDPTIIAEKVRGAGPEAMAAAFLASWRRIATIEYLGEDRLRDAINYYLELPPLRKRFFRLGSPPRVAPPRLEAEELRRLRIITDAEFRRALEEVRGQLEKYSEGVEYYRFIRGRDWEETLFRAYVLAHLLSLGLAHLDYDPIQNLLLLRPPGGEQRTPPRSFAIPLDISRLVG